MTVRMLRSSAALVVAAFLCATELAHADCAPSNVDPRQLRPGDTPCPTPTVVTPPASRPLEASYAETVRESESGSARWEDRRGRLWESAAGPALMAIMARDRATTFHAGVTATFGIHWLTRRRSGSVLDVSIPAGEELRWCMPMGCGGVGLLFAPSGSVLGNEIGVDLDVTAANDVGRVMIRPVFRYSDGVFRTPSFVSFLAPAVGLSRADTADGVRSFATVAFSLYPVDWRVSRTLALGITPFRTSLMVDLEGARPRAELSLDLSLRFVP